MPKKVSTAKTCGRLEEPRAMSLMYLTFHRIRFLTNHMMMNKILKFKSPKKSVRMKNLWRSKTLALKSTSRTRWRRNLLTSPTTTSPHLTILSWLEILGVNRTSYLSWSLKRMTLPASWTSSNKTSIWIWFRCSNSKSNQTNCSTKAQTHMINRWDTNLLMIQTFRHRRYSQTVSTGQTTWTNCSLNSTRTRQNSWALSKRVSLTTRMVEASWNRIAISATLTNRFCPISTSLQ